MIREADQIEMEVRELCGTRNDLYYTLNLTKAKSYVNLIYYLRNKSTY